MYDEAVVDALMAASAAKDLAAKVRAFSTVRPKDLAPRPPALADLSSGLTMGDAAEKMARENGISRQDQDAYTLGSHQKAVEAWEKGVFDDEVMPFPLPPGYETTVTMDGIPRPDTSLEKLAALKPVFDRRYGTVTAGNSSPLTDGAAAVVLVARVGRRRPRPRAAGGDPVLGLRRPRPVVADADGTGVRHPGRARPRRASPWTTSTWSTCTRRSPPRCCRTCRRSPRPRLGETASRPRASRSGRSTPTGSTSTAGRSRWATPSPPPAPARR